MNGRSPAAVLVDAAGNQVGVLLDGTVYRLQTSTVLDASSAKLMDNYDLLQNIYVEIVRVRTLLEIIADENVSEVQVPL